MGKSVICIVATFIFLIIDTVMACLKSNPVFAKNDKDNYCVYYQKWIKTVMFMGSIIVSLFCIYFAVNFLYVICYSLLAIQCLLVVIYALCKYKCVTVTHEQITVERLFQPKLETTYSDINSVHYYPNAKIVVKLKNRNSFELSFNSENFHRFFISLMEHKVKFKTAKVPNDENHVYLSKYNLTIDFTKNMFREFYQGKRYFHNSNYLFSARNLEKEEYIEGYYKESSKELNEFIDIVKTDLAINNFVFKKQSNENLDGYDFTLLFCNDKEDSLYKRCAFIYKDIDNYLVLYCDYLGENEESFITQMKTNIHRSKFEDDKKGLVRI